VTIIILIAANASEFVTLTEFAADRDTVNLLDRAQLLAHIVRWRLTWDRRDTAYLPEESLSDKFKSARAAADMIPDSACVISCGISGNARCSIFFWAVRERYEQSRHPQGLTWISVGGQGGRSRAPGTVEEVGLDGLVTTYIAGHTETAKSLLRLADAARLELHTLPQGEMAHVIEAQGRGEREVRSRTGIGTFLDPREGRGSPVTPNAKMQFARAAGDEIIYTLPAIDVALFSAPYADRDGNIYFNNAATITEGIESTRAARRNGGLAMVSVAGLVDRDDAAIGLHADEVDVVVINPRNEQTGSVLQHRHWPMFTAGANVDEYEAISRLRFVNKTLGITPRRSPVDYALARLGAKIFADNVPVDATVNIGVGLGEEVCRVLCEHNAHEQITFTTESGPVGGIPAPGIFFGAAINPKRLESSAWMFHHYHENLDATMLGFLQIDSTGNLNLSNRGPRMLDYVGPGGASSIIDSANTVLFIGKWMQGAKVSIDGGRLRLDKPGKPKLVDRVDEVTFNGRVGLAQGKKVFYVTDLAVLELTDAGLTLRAVMPGIDIERDLLANSLARIVVPDDPVPQTVAASIVTGKGFDIKREP
jgi:propionate CoA-transferase